MNRHKHISLILLVTLVYSCNVTNNLYLADPTPLGTGNMELGIGAGTGLKPEIDSVSSEGQLVFNDDYNFAPIVYFGGQYGINEQVNLRFSMHFPYLIGGFGLRGGIQYSLFKNDAKFNTGIGVDLGFVLAKDTLNVFGVGIPMEITTQGAIHGDIFIPIAYNFNESFSILLSGRYSVNGVFIRTHQEETNTQLYTPKILAISGGIRIKSVYLEYSNLFIEDKLVPSFGFMYRIPVNTKESP